MATSADIKKRARALSDKTNTESIGPVEVGNLMYDSVEYAEEVERNGGTLGIRKVYTSVVAMEADDVTPVDLWGNKLKRGNLVVIYDGTGTGVDNNKVYAFSKPGWEMVTRVDAGFASRRDLSEYNVSVQHPTSGIDGTNKYTLSGAIALVPQGLRQNVGLKCSFLGVEGKVETWEYQGETFTDASNWKQLSFGGNKILEWKIDAVTTRKQVKTNERKAGLMVSYLHPDNGWVNEQYIGTAVTYTEWVKNGNWEIIAKEKSVVNLSNNIDKKILSKVEFTKKDAYHIYENIIIVSNGRCDSSTTSDFYLFDTGNIDITSILTGKSEYVTFTKEPTVAVGIFVTDFKYNLVINDPLIIDESIKYIGFNVDKSVLGNEVLMRDISGLNFIKEKYIKSNTTIQGIDSTFIPSGTSRITKTKIYDVDSGEVYIIKKIAPAAVSRFVGLYKGEPSDDTFIFSYESDDLRIVVPSDTNYNYKLVISLANGPFNVGQNLKVYKIENLNGNMTNYLTTSQYASNTNDYYDLIKRFSSLLKGSNQFIDYDFENNEPIAYNGKEITETLINGSIPFLVSLGGGIPGGSGGYYTFKEDEDGRYILFTYNAIQQGGYLYFPKKYLKEYSSKDTWFIGFLTYITSTSSMAFMCGNIVETNKWVWVEHELDVKGTDYAGFAFKLKGIGETAKIKHICLKNTTKDGPFIGFEVNEATYLKGIITSSSGADNLFVNKELVMIGDSLFLELAGNNIPKSLATKLRCNLLANYTKGGVGTIGTDNECGMMRARKIEEVKDKVDIIIYENVNDGGNAGSIDDEGFMLTQQVNVNVPPEQTVEDYWTTNFYAIVGNINPKVGTMLRLAVGSEGFSIEVSGTASSSGNVSFIVGEMVVNVPVSTGDNAEKVMTAIDTYPFFDEGYVKDGESSTTTKCIYINKTDSELVIPSITNSVKGLSVTSAKVGGYEYTQKIFHSHDVSLWNNQAYWKDSISLYAQYKGLIEYFCTTCPQAWVFIMACSRYCIAYAPEHLSSPLKSWEPPKRADGSYDIDKFQKEGASYIRYDKHIPDLVREVCEYMHVNCLDLPRYDCINVYNASHYYKSCDVHIQYKKIGIERWVETIYRQMIGKG